jgi:hemoglobin
MESLLEESFMINAPIKQDIESSNDIDLLVRKFYAKVTVNKTLGPIFNKIISDWEEHLIKLISFWEANLLFVNTGYRGNPGYKHILVDQHFNHTIEQKHFGIWLQLWFETLDELFEGEKQILAKERARKMGHMFFMKMYMARQAKGAPTKK